MSSYILSIVGVVFLGVLVDVIMPEGEMNKFIKGAFALVAVFVIVSPAVKLFNSDFDIENIFYNQTSIHTDSDFLDATTKQMQKELETVLKVKLQDAGFDNVQVEIVCDLSNNVLEIKKVYIDISKMVINTNMTHINKYTEIKNVATNMLNV